MHAIDDMADLPLRTVTDIGALIRDRRRGLKLDQAELADMIGVSRLWVNQVERGKPGAGLGLVLRALEAVGVTLAVRNDRAEGPPVFTPDINAIVAAHRRKPVS
jgi:HTH-type transcriptional regulator/antitoxin HipB